MVEKITTTLKLAGLTSKINEIIDNLVSSLTGLSDVQTSSPSSGQVLGYDGSKWTNTDKTLVTFRDWT